MKCQICGNNIQDDSQFCRICGTSLSASTGSGVGAAPPELHIDMKVIGTINVPWRTHDVLIGAALVVIGAFSLVAIVAMLTDASATNSIMMLNFIIAATSALLIFTSVILGPLKYRVPISKLGLKVHEGSTFTVLATSSAVLLSVLVFNTIYGAVVSHLGWSTLEPPELPFGPNLGMVSLLFAGLLVTVVGPIAEEVFFRGFALPGLARSFGPVGAALTSSLLFSLAHASPSILIPTFFAGLLLAWLYLRTRSLLSCVIVHGAQNAVAYIVTITG